MCFASLGATKIIKFGGELILICVALFEFLSIEFLCFASLIKVQSSFFFPIVCEFSHIIHVSLSFQSLVSCFHVFSEFCANKILIFEVFFVCFQAKIYSQ